MSNAKTLKPSEEPSAWPAYDVEAGQGQDYAYGSTVSQCDAIVRRGFLRKVFGLVAVQLTTTVRRLPLLGRRAPAWAGTTGGALGFRRIHARRPGRRLP